MAFRLFPKQKLCCKRQFDHVFKARKRLYSRYFLAYYQSNQLAHPRVGIIIAKRNVRFAVQRNTIRRIIKEQFRLQQAVLPAFDLVFVAKKGSDVADNKELQQCLLDLMSKLSMQGKK